MKLNKGGGRANNTVVEKISLGGVSQYIYIRSKDPEKPVLLFLHGGPGFPEFWAFKKFNHKLENYFTVVNWDQRGAGKSYSTDIPADSMNKDQFLKDLHQLVLYLLDRFDKEKLLLVSHSWGTCFGLKFAELYPSLISAYIGVSQVITRSVEEEMSFTFALEKAGKSRIPFALKQLNRVGPPVNGYYQSTSDMLISKFWTSAFGGFIDSHIQAFKIFSRLPFTKEYSIRDLIKIYQGLNFSLKYLWDDFATTDFFNSLSEIKIPIYFIMGENDRVTFSEMVKTFINKVNAPEKELIIIPNSSHMCCFERPEAFCRIVLDKVKDS